MGVLFKGVLKEAIAKSNSSGACKKFNDVPKESLFSRVVTTLTCKYEVKAKCLARKVIKLYDETQGNGQDL